MINTRRLLAVVCTAVMLFAAITPAAVHLLCDVLVPLGPLFGIVISAQVQDADDVNLETAAVLLVRTPRAPPLA